eukprot:3589730-Ditylum_brightwellii.AAC.1
MPVDCIAAYIMSQSIGSAATKKLFCHQLNIIDARQDKAAKKREEDIEKLKQKKEKSLQEQKKDEDGVVDAVVYHNELQQQGLALLQNRAFTVEKMRKLIYYFYDD